MKSCHYFKTIPYCLSLCPFSPLSMYQMAVSMRSCHSSAQILQWLFVSVRTKHKISNSMHKPLLVWLLCLSHLLVYISPFIHSVDFKACSCLHGLSHLENSTSRFLHASFLHIFQVSVKMLTYQREPPRTSLCKINNSLAIWLVFAGGGVVYVVLLLLFLCVCDSVLHL